jgi:hypothetical protein
MEKIEYRYRFWYRPKFMVSDWYRIEPKKAGIAHHYILADLANWGEPNAGSTNVSTAKSLIFQNMKKKCWHT